MNQSVKTSNFVEHQLDAKHRVAVPSDWRPAPGERLYLVPSKTYGQSVIRAYFPVAYQRKLEEIDTMPRFEGKPSERDTARHIFKTRTHEVEVNSQGKLTIPNNLALAVKLPVPGRVILEFNRDEAIEIMNVESHDAITEALAAAEDQYADLFAIG